MEDTQIENLDTELSSLKSELIDTAATVEKLQEGSDKPAQETPVESTEQPLIEPKVDNAPAELPQESSYAKAKRTAKERIEALAKEKNEWKTRFEEMEKQLKTRETSKDATSQVPDASDPLPNWSTEDLKHEIERLQSEGEFQLAFQAQQALFKKLQLAPKQQSEQFTKNWDAVRNHTMESFPDLKNPESELFKAAEGLFADKQWGNFLRSHPLGTRAAAEVAGLILEAKKISDLNKQLETANKEINRLKKLTAIGGSEPAQLREKKFEELPIDEQLAELKKSLSAG